MTPQMPKTVAEAVEIILASMSEENKKYFLSIEREDIVRQHHSTGRNIRNDFGLWGRNPELLEDCNEIQKKYYPEDYRACQRLYATYKIKMTLPIHPDDASGVILDELWKRIQEDGKGKT